MPKPAYKPTRFQERIMQIPVVEQPSEFEACDLTWERGEGGVVWLLAGGKPVLGIAAATARDLAAWIVAPPPPPEPEPIPEI